MRLTFRNSLQCYALMVCFITAIFSCFFLTALLDNFITFSYPKYKIGKSLKVFETEQNYLMFLKNEVRYTKEKTFIPNEMSQSELAVNRNWERSLLIDQTKEIGRSGLISALIRFVISFGFWLVHWRLYRKTEHAKIDQCDVLNIPTTARTHL